MSCGSVWLGDKLLSPPPRGRPGATGQGQAYGHGADRLTAQNSGLQMCKARATAPSGPLTVAHNN